ncbi:sensor histidine kinase [Paenibacillus sonchi]|uniref:Sensor histidine kinase n=1 Tax=Paenibacillus sonchi TaxID=373687 RepID=A0A974PGP2_9BACL|nr:histidine kinase [Paenibacillus sonchi]QQZ63048.1 sensor histidine kinase [Paenibacillus sonchi]
MGKLKWLWPSSMKNRLVLSILLFVLIPSAFLQIRNITQLETMMKDNISQQNTAQLNFLKNNIESLKFGVLGAMLQLERDPDLREQLGRTGENMPEKNMFIKNELLLVKQRLMNAIVPVHLTLVDDKGEVYNTLEEGMAVPAVSGAELLQQPEFVKLRQGAEAYYWTVHEPDYLLANALPGSQLFSLFSKLQGTDGHTFAYLRISLDMKTWLNSITGGFQVKQTYYLLDGGGQPILMGRNDRSAQALGGMLATFKSNPARYFTDDKDLFIFNGTYLPNMDWYLVSRFPLEALSGNILAMKREVMLSFLVTCIIFAGIMYAIVSSTVRPLHNLQKKMSELVDKNLNVSIPERKYKGELLRLARAFNLMTGDIRKLIERLQMEERQKEAIRFQMLMSQMNPHFLLNTLNTIKWNARNHGDMGTSEICQNLGKLLESGLNSDADLVFLKEEIELIRAYVYIQSFRYDHSFNVEYMIGDGLEYALIPKFSLQPLVENAIYHGLVHMKAGGKITILIAGAGGRLRVEIGDNGQGLERSGSASGKRRKGIGLSNLRERILLLYKGRGELLLLPLPQGTVAVLDIPLLNSLPYDKEERNVENTSGRR